MQENAAPDVRADTSMTSSAALCGGPVAIPPWWERCRMPGHTGAGTN